MRLCGATFTRRSNGAAHTFALLHNGKQFFRPSSERALYTWPSQCIWSAARYKKEAARRGVGEGGNEIEGREKKTRKCTGLAEWRGRSHSTRDRQQRERVAVGLLCMYRLFRSRSSFSGVAPRNRSPASQIFSPAIARWLERVTFDANGLGAPNFRGFLPRNL